MIIRVSEQAVEVNLLKYVVPCLIQNRQLKIRGIVCSPPSYVVEALGRGAFKFHLSTLWVQSSKCSRGATYLKYLSTLEAQLFNMIDLLGGASFFQPKAFYWDIQATLHLQAYVKPFKVFRDFTKVVLKCKNPAMKIHLTRVNIARKFMRVWKGHRIW